METYLAIKPALMLAVLLSAFGLFFFRVRSLVRLMRAVGGETTCRADRIFRRIIAVVIDVLGQANVRRKRLPGLAHALIFYGFLAVQPHSLELMIQGVFPRFEVSRAAAGVYGAYLSVADILAALVLPGLGYALYRRLIERPGYLTDNRDARLIIFFTAVIIVSFHFINGLRGLLPPGPGDFAYAPYLTVSAALAGFFNLQALSAVRQAVFLETAYWIHLLTIFGFLVYIPGSKHLHLLAAAPNVFLKPLEREKAMFRTDIEDESAESFGLGKVSDLSWKSVLDLYACTECGRCQEQCPADISLKPLSPKRMIADVKHDLLTQSRAILTADLDAVEPLVREGAAVSADVLWSCTSCRACEDICPVNIQHLDIILEARKYQVLMEAAFPPEMQETFTHLENQANPWGFAADTRADWCRDMDVPLMSDRPEAAVLYFVGCAGAFDERGKKIARAVVRVLQKAGVDFAILGPEERCNGDLARRAGNEYLAQMMIRENVEILGRYRPKSILASCPHCYNVLKNEYPQFGARYAVAHHSEFMRDLFSQGRLRLRGAPSQKTTFHDSCYLGRWNGIYEAPRELLRIITNSRCLPMPQRSADKGFCCGAGGGRMFMEESIGKRINAVRAGELLSTGAATVAAACPFCVTMLADGIADCGGAATVKDLAEMVDEATE